MTEATLEDSEVQAVAIDAKSAGRRAMLAGAIVPTRYAFEMKMYWYYLNLEGPESWTMAAMGRRANLIDVNQFRLFGKPWTTPRRQPKRLAKTIKYFGTQIGRAHV